MTQQNTHTYLNTNATWHSVSFIYIFKNSMPHLRWKDQIRGTKGKIEWNPQINSVAAFRVINPSWWRAYLMSVTEAESATRKRAIIYESEVKFQSYLRSNTVYWTHYGKAEKSGSLFVCLFVASFILYIIRMISITFGPGGSMLQTEDEI